MSPGEITSKQMWRWLLLAGFAGLAHFASGGYMAAALAAGAILPLSLILGGGFGRIGRVLSFLEWSWMVVILSQLLPASGAYWPGEKAELVVPLVLLAMAALSGGTERTARVCNTLFWITGVVAAGILLGSAGKLETQWLKPEPGNWDSGLIVTLLIPGITGALVPEEKGKAGAVLCYGILAIVLAAVLQGMLSIPVAQASDGAMYELGRGIGQGGFEVLVSAGMTFGWYGLAALLFRTAAEFGEKWGIGDRVARCLGFVCTGTLLLLGLKVDEVVMVGVTLGMWILAPMLHMKK